MSIEKLILLIHGTHRKYISSICRANGVDAPDCPFLYIHFEIRTARAFGLFESGQKSDYFQWLIVLSTMARGVHLMYTPP